MATVANIIFDALAEIGVVGAGDEVSGADYEICLRKLNQALQRWSNRRLMAPELSEVSVLLNGAANYTIGPSGGVLTARPIRVERAIASGGGVDYPVKVYTRDEWDAIAVKDVTGGPPEAIWYESSAPNGRVWVYPKSADYTLKLDVLTLLTSYSAISDEIALPEGYETALTLTLADDVATLYGRQTTPDTRRRLAAAMAAIRTTNAEPLYLVTGMPGEDFRIERGF